LSRREEKDRMRVYAAEVRGPSDTESRVPNGERGSRIIDVAGEDWQHFMPGDAKSDRYGSSVEEMQEGEQKRDKMRKRRSIIGWFKHA